MPGGERVAGYFDTSVLVKCYIAERGSTAALAALERFAVVCSSVAPVEFAGALRRYRETAEPGAADTVEAHVRRERDEWRLIAVTDQVLDRAETVTSSQPVRALDALHLASALVFRQQWPRDVPFVTADDRQRRAAAALGLKVVFVE